MPVNDQEVNDHRVIVCLIQENEIAHSSKEGPERKQSTKNKLENWPIRQMDID